MNTVSVGSLLCTVETDMVILICIYGRADVPLEAVVSDASVLALEAGKDADMLDSMDALELDDEAEEGSSTGKAGKGKRKPKVQPDSGTKLHVVLHCTSTVSCTALHCTLCACCMRLWNWEQSKPSWSRWS